MAPKIRDLSTITLAEFEAIAARMSAAATTMREAMSLMNPNGVHVVAPAPWIAPNITQATSVAQPSPIEVVAVVPSGTFTGEIKSEADFRRAPPPKVRWSPSELATKAALLESMKRGREEAAMAPTESEEGLS